jgi:hypothetical protein
VRWGPDLVTGEGRGSPEGGFHGGTARPEGNGGDRRRPEVEAARRWSSTTRQGISGIAVGVGEMA